MDLGIQCLGSRLGTYLMKVSTVDVQVWILTYNVLEAAYKQHSYTFILLRTVYLSTV
jgi:hypothetical protein